MWISLFLLTALLAYLIMSLISSPRQETPSERLERLVAQRKAMEGFATRDLPGLPLAPEEERAPRISIQAATRQALVGLVDRVTRDTGHSNRLEALLQRADWRWKPAEFMVAQGVAAGTGLLVALFFAPQFWWLMPLVGWYMPRYLLNSAISRRQKVFNQQLPDALAMIANALRSGYSFLQAMDVVSREMPDPVSKEFSLVLKESRVNIPLEEALQNMVERVQSADLDLVVTAVLIQRQVGGNLSEVLDKITETIRDRIRLQGEIRALTAQGRLSGWVVSLLPLVLAVLMYFIAPAVFRPMLSHPLGLGMLGLGVTMQLIGIFAIRRMVNMEV